MLKCIRIICYRAICHRLYCFSVDVGLSVVLSKTERVSSAWQIFLSWLLYDEKKIVKFQRNCSIRKCLRPGEEYYISILFIFLQKRLKQTDVVKCMHIKYFYYRIYQNTQKKNQLYWYATVLKMLSNISYFKILQ